jgi:hypothetical protein
MRAAVLALVSLGASASADPMPMSAGDQPAPSTSAEIALAREELTIDVTRTEARVRAVLHLENRGPAARIPVGFPCDAGDEPGLAGLDCRTKIQVVVDGKKVAAKKKRAHWVWPMRFAAGQKVDVEVSYASKLRNDRYEQGFSGMGTLYYRLATGARWAGPIGELSMRVTLPTDAVAHIAPPGYTREPGVVTWSLRDLEPTSDVALLFHPRYLAASARELRANADEIARFATFFQEVARGKLGLPAPTEAEVRATVEESAKLMEAAAAPSLTPK